jgi:hypothetical protein
MVSEVTLKVHLELTIKLLVYCDFSIVIIDYDEVFPDASE